MKMYISSNRTVSDVQQDFNAVYRFLTIEFYPTASKQRVAGKQRLKKTDLLPVAAKPVGDVVEISDAMTVAQLEETFRERFGMNIQVARKSGILWLETTMTDNWTLKQQNDHGKELSEPLSNNQIPPDASVGDNAG